MSPRKTIDITQAQVICREILPKVSRSFTLAIQALPEPTRDYIFVTYLLCRMMDTINHPSYQ